MKEQILELRKQGKSYRQIEKILHCSRSLISYYVNPEGKQKKIEAQNKNRYRKRSEYKLQAGGKCQICGYNKCLEALHFHHKTPSEKNFSISEAIWGVKKKISDKEIKKEIQKCILLCANCHYEMHYN